MDPRHHRQAPWNQDVEEEQKASQERGDIPEQKKRAEEEYAEQREYYSER